MACSAFSLWVPGGRRLCSTHCCAPVLGRVVLNGCAFATQGTLGNFWKQFWFSHLGSGVYYGHLVGRLQGCQWILHGTGQLPPHTDRELCNPNIDSVDIKKTCFSIRPGTAHMVKNANLIFPKIACYNNTLSHVLFYRYFPPWNNELMSQNSPGFERITRGRSKPLYYSTDSCWCEWWRLILLAVNYLPSSLWPRESTFCDALCVSCIFYYIAALNFGWSWIAQPLPSRKHLLRSLTWLNVCIMIAEVTISKKKMFLKNASQTLSRIPPADTNILAPHEGLRNFCWWHSRGPLLPALKVSYFQHLLVMLMLKAN